MSRQSIMMWLRLNIPNKSIVIVMLKKERLPVRRGGAVAGCCARSRLRGTLDKLREKVS